MKRDFRRGVLLCIVNWDVGGRGYEGGYLLWGLL